MPKPKDFCTVDPPFPAQGFIVTLMVTKKGGTKAMYPFDLVYTSVTEMANDLALLRKELATEGNIYRIPDPCYVQQISLLRRFPLRREFWEHPEDSFTADARADVFLQAMDKPALYSLLVTPTKEKTQWRFMAALPIPVTTPDRVLEQFMLHSDWPVAQESKYAAIYSVGNVQVFDWGKKKLVHKSRMLPPKNTVH